MPEDIGKILTRRALDWGAANLRIEQGGKQPRLVGDFNGKTFLFAFPGSTGDWRAAKNCVSNLRRLLGVERTDRVGDPACEGAFAPCEAKGAHGGPVGQGHPARGPVLRALSPSPGRHEP